MAGPKPPGTLVDGDGDDGNEAPLTYAPGDHIAGRYEIAEVVGHGATATVYRVFDHASHEEVAVKLIGDPEGGIDKLRHEVRLARKVTHPNVCRVFDIVEHRHGALLSMEYADGGTLADRVGRRHDDADVAGVAAQILDGLEAAHAAGVVHRDLKPANVLVGAGGAFKLSDFGVAQPAVVVLDTEQGDGAGTPAYMAPEQLRGEAADERTDLYAVGLILYELLAGSLPFVGRGEEVTLPAALRRLDRDVPPIGGSVLFAGVRAMLARDRDDRPATVAAARVALGLQTTVASAARGPRRLIVTLSLIAVAIAGLALWKTFSDRTTTSPRDDGATTAAVDTTPLTRALTGAEEHIAEAVAFTPDGESMIISTDRGGVWQLWSVSTDEAMQRQLTTGTVGARGPQVRGDWLYYRREADLVRVPLARLARRQSWTDTDAQVVLTDVRDAHVGPDGRIAAVPIGDERALDIAAPGGGARERLFTGEHPVGSAQWSPDGSRIAYGDRPWGDAEPFLYVVDSATGERRQLRSVKGFTGLTWTADGRSLVYFRGSGDARVLARIDVDSGDEQVLITRLRDAALPILAPDGRLAYLVDTWSYDLWLFERDQLRRVTYLGDEDVVSPHWVRGADELLYGVTRPQRSGVELRRLTGPTFTDVTAVRTIPAAYSSMAVSPDGTIVVFTEIRGDEYLLQRAEVTSNAPPVVLVRSALPMFALHFTPTGRVSYVDVGSDTIYDIAIDGTERRALVEDAGGGFHSQDGSWMVFARPGASTNMWIQAKDSAGVPSGEPRELPGSVPIENVRWNPGTNEVVVMDRDELAVIDPSSLERRRLALWPPGTREPSRLAVHEDGRVACTIAVGRSSVKLVENFADVSAR